METVGEFEYNAKDLIGHGAFAVVFKGRQKKSSGRTVAIKSITKKNLSKTHNLLGKEIKILKELSEIHHENIVALLDCKETSHHVFLVMEYCNGGDLADYLAVKGTLSEDTIRLFLRQLAGAMKALQAKGIVHRDLKPQNILLSHAGKPNPQPHEIRLKIADFGFARFLQDGVMAATLCGSPMYMAPEVIMSLQYDAKADLWSLGTIVFQCLTGRAPFTAPTPHALKMFYERNQNLSPKIPSGTSKELTDLLQNLLRRDPKDRIEFDDFFDHAFIRKPASLSSSPLPVPAIMTVVSNPSPARCSVVEAATTAAQNNNVSTPEEADDFVLVPSPSEKHLVLQDVNAAPVQNQQSQPIPVPSQREAFLKMNRSIAQQDASSVSPNAAGIPGSGGRAGEVTQVPRSQPICVGKNDSTTMGSSGNSRTPVAGEISSLSPPSVQFCVGTPPGIAGRRRSTSSSSCGTPPPHSAPAWSALNNSPLRRTTYASAGSGGSVTQATLPTIIGSPTKYALEKNSTASPTVVHWRNATDRKSPLTLEYPSRAMTLPVFDSTSAIGPSGFTSVGFHRSNTDGQLSSSPRQGQGRYSPGQWNLGCTSGTSATGWNSKRRSLEHNAGTYAFGTSPTFNEGPLVFVAPELTEETLLEKEHNETLAKLNFILALVECIIEIAKTRSSPLAAALSESVHSRNASNLASSPAQRDMTVAPTNTISDGQGKREELVLYVRALQYLSSALNLSRDELQAKNLHPSTCVKQVVALLNKRFHQCLVHCKQLASASPTVDCSTAHQMADKILYNHAIELCQSAALDELFGNPASCCRRYQTAHILFHSLAQQVSQPSDKAILSKYKEAVEKRLYVLQQQGLIYAYDTS